MPMVGLLVKIAFVRCGSGCKYYTAAISGTVVNDEVESQHLRTMELTIRHKGTKAASLGMVKRVSAGPLG